MKILTTILCTAILALSVNTQSSRRPDLSWQIVYFDNTDRQITAVVDAQNITEALGIFEHDHPDASKINSVSRRSYVDCAIIDRSE